ncbi:ATPase [Aureococcus anophagefferens]|nr:ATPase [Aureococcus anophagefferens]
MLPGEYRVKAPGALVRAGIEQSSARVTELATDAALVVEEVKLNGRGVARARAGAAAATRPPPRRARRPAPVATEVSSDAGVVSIGGVSSPWRATSTRRSCAAAAARLRLRVLARPRLQWMLRKAALRQDMFLLGDAGPRCRQLALAFCELARREAEFVSLTRDSNESDLKQRRELRGGDLAWADQPPVAAAKRGRVLILEGVEKAERNVLPLLNNLLENREMALEDGTFLTPANAGARLARHDDFLVVAIGRPAARYARRKDDDAVAPLAVPLDPPLRSRFVSRRVGGLAPSEDAACLAALGVDDGPTRDALARFCAGARALSDASAAEDGAVAAPRFPEGGGLSVGALLVAFPGAPFYGFAGRAFPAAALALDKAAEKALRDLGGARVAVTAVVQDLACCRGVGACVVGERGCGKSAILRAACAALGYGPGRARYVFCHRELSARELLQRRGAEKGRTSWRDGAVVAAAIRGDVAVLDGVHRLAPGVLAGSLGRLICDGEAQLPDGRRLVRADDWDRLAAAFSAEELEAKGLVKLARLGKRLDAAATLDGAAAKRAIDGAFAARLRFAPATRGADGLADRALASTGADGGHVRRRARAADAGARVDRAVEDRRRRGAADARRARRARAEAPAHWLICTQVESCAYESELRLLRAAAPRAPAEALVDASLLWRDLRGLVDEGRLSYPYSTRVPASMRLRRPGTRRS